MTKHRFTEEPCDAKVSSTVLESSGSRERVADFNFLNRDDLPKYGEKPERWKPSGRRTKRGLYKSMFYGTINADCNGAANIVRKVATTLGIEPDRVSRGALTRPTRIKVWVTAKNTERCGFTQILHLPNKPVKNK